MTVPTSATTDALRHVMGADERPDEIARAKLLEEVRLGLFGEHAQTRVGRYRMIERLGGGGQGVVWVARDPDLQRDVAIKILRSEGKRHPHAHRRLLREAAALARLSHPNVVAVNDVGECELGVYVVTELVVGQTLGEWLMAGHPWREVLAVFLDAGQGLVAAHAQGIVHRDFKPANVLIGEDGRARLLDFGLAREADTSAPSDSGPGERTAAASGRASGSSAAVSATVTRPGTAMGTPAYKAPEQHAGVAADFAADQFAFCASLYEGLFGQRPYPQKSIGEIAAAKLAGRIAAPPKASPIPRALHGVVVRGLSASPSRRYPSMQALLAALRDAARPRRRRRVLAVGLAAIATTAALAAATIQADTPSPATVPSDTPVAHDRDTPPPHLATAVAALRQRIELGKSLATAGEPFEALEILRAAERDAVTLGFDPVVVDARIAHALMLHQTGERVRAKTRMESAYFLAESSGVDELAFTASLHLVRFHGSEDGDIPVGTSWLRRAEAALERLGMQADPIEHGMLLRTAADLSSRAGDNELALAQARRAEEILEMELAPDDPRRVYGFTLIARTLLILNRLDEAQRTADRGLELARRLLGPDHMGTAKAINVRALIAKHRGDFEAALELQLQGLAVYERSPDPDEAAMAGLLGNIGVLYSEMGQPAEAEASYRRALALQRAHLGDDDPLVARTLHNLAITVRDRRRFDEALSLWREAIAIANRTLGPEHPETAAFEFMYGVVLAGLDRADEALPRLEHALAVARASRGEDHPETAQRLSGLADAQRRLGRMTQANANIREALAIMTKALGPEHPEVGRTRHFLGLQLEEEQDYEAALVEFQAALEILEASLGTQHTALPKTLYGIARVQTELGHRREADEAVRRADAIIEATQGSAPP